MISLGDRVIYRVPPQAHCTTRKGDAVLHGSTFHPSMIEFGALIGQLYPDGTADLMVLIPGNPTRWVNRVCEGAGPGCFEHAGTREKVAPPKEKAPK